MSSASDSSDSEHSTNISNIKDVDKLHKIVFAQRKQLKKLNNELKEINRKYIASLETIKDYHENYHYANATDDNQTINTDLEAPSTSAKQINNKIENDNQTTIQQSNVQRWLKSKKKWIPQHKQRRQEQQLMSAHVQFLKATKQNNYNPNYKRNSTYKSYNQTKEQNNYEQNAPNTKSSGHHFNTPNSINQTATSKNNQYQPLSMETEY